MELGLISNKRYDVRDPSSLMKDVSLFPDRLHDVVGIC